MQDLNYTLCIVSLKGLACVHCFVMSLVHECGSCHAQMVVIVDAQAANEVLGTEEVRSARVAALDANAMLRIRPWVG